MVTKPAAVAGVRTRGACGRWCLATTWSLVIAVAGCGGPMSPSASLCRNPAPLEGKYDPNKPGLAIAFKRDVDAESETQRLADKYQFVPRTDIMVLNGFAADLSGEIVARLRCEPSVAYVVYVGSLVPVP